MPLYEYRCPSCNHEEEQFHRIVDRHEATCTHCGARLDVKFSVVHSRLAVPFAVFDGSGRMVHFQPDSEATEPPTPPDKAHWIKGRSNLVEV